MINIRRVKEDTYVVVETTVNPQGGQTISTSKEMDVDGVNEVLNNTIDRLSQRQTSLRAEATNISEVILEVENLMKEFDNALQAEKDAKVENAEAKEEEVEEVVETE